MECAANLSSVSKDARKSHPTPQERATAVARVLAGESRRGVAQSMGVSASTVSGWVKTAESPETEQAQSLAERARLIADEIEHAETIARDRLIHRITELAVFSQDLTAVTNAYDKLGQRALLRAGKPTSITQTKSSDVDEAIERLLADHDEADRHGSLNGNA